MPVSNIFFFSPRWPSFEGQEARRGITFFLSGISFDYTHTIQSFRRAVGRPEKNERVSRIINSDVSGLQGLERKRNLVSIEEKKKAMMAPFVCCKSFEI